MKKNKVSFIGLGAMGQPMASNIVRKGTALTVYDIDAARMEPVVALGATGAKTVAEAVAGADIVITMLPATQHVEAVVTGANGVLENVGKGSLLLDMSTIAPTGTDRIAKACAAKGIAFVDAPVGRLAYHAQRGESLFMVGCDDDASFERVRPLLEAMGTTIHRCGGIGAGIRTKVVNNFMIISIVQITAEGLALAAKMGVDIDIAERGQRRYQRHQRPVPVQFCEQGAARRHRTGFRDRSCLQGYWPGAGVGFGVSSRLAGGRQRARGLWRGACH